MKKKTTLQILLVLTLVGVVLIYFLKERFLPNERYLSCNPNEGSVFDINYLSSGGSDLSLFQSSQQRFKIFFSGKVQEICLENNLKYLSYLMDFNNSKVFLNNQEIIKNSQANQDNSKKAYVKILRSGVITEIKFSKYLDPFMANIYRDYIANSFVNFDHFSSKNSSWKNSIDDYSGKISFKYSFLDSSKVQKNFVNVDPLQDSYLIEEAKNVNKLYSNDSTAIYELSYKNIPIVIDFKRIASFYLNNKKIGDEETIFSKKKVEDNSIQLAINKASALLFRSPEFYITNLNAKEVEQRLKEKTLVQNLKYSSFHDFLMQSDFKLKGRYTEYFLQLKSLFSLKISSIFDSIPYLVKSENSSEEFNLILSALVTSGSVEAQKSLIETYSMLTNTTAKIILLANLATVEHPSLGTEAFIKSQWQENDRDIRNTAVLAMGNIGKNIQVSETQRHDHIYKDLLSELQNAKNIFEKQVALLALGNLSDKRSLHIIYQETLSDQEEIRKSASFALRFINLPEPDKYLEKILTEDPSDSVKLSALEALSYRKPTAEILDIEKKILRNDPSETLRMQSLKNLAQVGEMTEIEYALKNDSSKSVRIFAENLMKRFQMSL